MRASSGPSVAGGGRPGPQCWSDAMPTAGASWIQVGYLGTNMGSAGPSGGEMLGKLWEGCWKSLVGLAGAERPGQRLAGFVNTTYAASNRQKAGI